MLLKIFAAIFVLMAIFSAASCRRDTPAVDTLEGISEVAYDSKQAATATLPPENLESVAARFTPLADNERLAFTVQQETGVTTFYAVDNYDYENFSAIYTRTRGITWSSIQFTGDFRNGFFVFLESAIWKSHLYMLNGLTGEVRRILTYMGGGPSRVSKDGRFAAFLHRTDNEGQEVNMYIFDIENESIVGEFIWQPWENISDPSILSQQINSFIIFRFDNIFKIYAAIDSGIVGGAILDPAAMTLISIWDNPYIFFESVDGYFSLDNLTWDDDVSFGAGRLDRMLQR